MSKMQMPKGYRQRQQDKQLGRWKTFLRKEKRKIESSKEGVVNRMVGSLDYKLVDALEEKRLAEKQADKYRNSWLAEKQLAEVWREENAALRKKLAKERLKFAILAWLCGWLILLIIVLIGGF